MKTVMIVIDGLGDEPIAQLNEKTPLESAFIPNIHYIANRGRIGQLHTCFADYPIESMVCIMGLLGYEPEKYYPNGRASFEAMAKGIPLHPSDLVLRCNIITVDPEQHLLTDFTAGLISDSHARTLISQINLPHDNWELYPGQSYRNVLIIRGANADVQKIRCYEPHMNIGRPIMEVLPRGADQDTQNLVEQINEFLLDTRAQISSMEVANRCAANMLWVWSPSIKPIWPSFKQRTGLNAALVGGLDFLHGIAMAADIHFDVIPGATGYIDTDYEAKGSYTIEYLRDFDFVLTHVNAADEEAHQRNYMGKIEAIEMTDRYIVGPVLYELQKNYPGDFRIVICGDHETRCSDGKHTDVAVPYAIIGKDIDSGNAPQFAEFYCRQESQWSSLELVKQLCCL